MDQLTSIIPTFLHNLSTQTLLEKIKLQSPHGFGRCPGNSSDLSLVENLGVILKEHVKNVFLDLPKAAFSTTFDVDEWWSFGGIKKKWIINVQKPLHI